MSSKLKSKTNKAKSSKPSKLSKSKPVTPKVNLADDVDYADEKLELEEIDEDIDEEIDESINELSKEPSKERYEYTPTTVQNIIYVLPENRRTSEILTKFECTEIISTRAVQIEQGGTCFTNTDLLSDPLQMARKELMDKKCPLDVIRAITNEVFERWHANEMGLPADF
jgi:DNA-directed RNA polymerase I, II, and III subunit RPABC2